MDATEYWAQVYSSKSSTDVSWYQEYPELSLEFIQRTKIEQSAAIIDVGAGASTFVDHLLERWYSDITLLDLSEAALEVAQKRIGNTQNALNWLVGDVTTIPLEPHRYDVWHDRAVFHFLTDPVQQQHYIEQVLRAVKPNGHVIVATFAPDGPEKCSGLTTARYDAESLHRVFGHQFELIYSTRETHVTPWESEQNFVYCYCRKGNEN